VREQVADAQAGERERLGERAEDDELRWRAMCGRIVWRENSKYASSTSTSASVASSRSMRNVSGWRLPVGLFGWAIITMSMSPSLTRARTAFSSMEKSLALRGTSTTSVPVMRASRPYIAKVGGMLSSLRPGPPHASIRSKISSSPPLPTRMLPASSPLASAIAVRNVPDIGSG